MINNYKHIIWDWNGTLLDDTILCMDVMNYFLRNQKKDPITVEQYKEIFTFPVFDYYLNAGLKITEDEFKELSIDFIDKYETFKYDCHLFPDVKTTIKKIKDQNISQSVLSAYSQDTLEEFLKHYELLDNFENVVGLDNIYAAGKLENGIKLMERLPVNASEVVLIGDTLHDYEVAHGIGADCILIARGHQSKERLVESGAKVLDSLKEIL